MSIDQATYRAVLGASAVLLHPSPSQEDLFQAGKVCEEFKARPDALQTCVYILDTNSPEHTEAARNFSLQVVLGLVQNQWDSFTPEVVASFKELALKGIQSWVRDLVTDVPHVKYKTAQLVVELAKREWPQRWPDLSDRLLALASMTDTQAEVVAMVFTGLADECSSNDLVTDMSTKRKATVMKGLTAILPSLLTPYITIIQGCLGAMQTGGDHPREAALLRSVLRLVASFVGWMPLQSVKDLHLVPMMEAVLQVPGFEEDILDCVILLGHRKIADEEFLLGFLASIVPRCAVPLASPSVPKYTLHRRATAAIADIGVQHGAWLRQQAITNKAAVPVLKSFVESLTAVQSYPSLLISSTALPVWKSMVDVPLPVPCPPEVAADPFESQLASILVLAARATQQDPYFVVDGTGERGASTPFVEQDFDGPDEYQRTYSVVKHHAMTLLETVGQNRPTLAAEAVNFLAQEFGPLCASIPAGSPFIHLKSNTALQGMAMLSSAAKIVSGLNSVIKAQASSQPDLVRGVTQRLEAALSACLRSTTENQPALMVAQLDFMSRCPPVVNSNQEALSVVVDRILAGVVWAVPAEKSLPPSVASGFESAVRLTAAHAVLSLAKASAMVLLSSRPDACQRLAELQMASSMLPAGRIVLLEALVIIANKFEDPAKQAELVAGMLKGSLEFWESAEMARLGTVEGLLAAAGALSGVPFVSGLDNLPETHQMVLRCLQSFAMVARKCKARKGLPPPFAPYWPRVLPLMCRLMVALHHVWEPKHRTRLNTTAIGQWVLTLCPDEMITCLGPVTDFDDLDEAARSNLLIPGWLSRVRMQTLAGLSQAFLHSELTFFTPGSMEALAILRDGLLSKECIGYVRQRHVSQIIKQVIVPLLKSCPSEAYASVLPSMVPPLLEYSLQLLSDSWGYATAIASGAVPTAGGGGAPCAVPEPPPTVADEGVGFLIAHGLDSESADQFQEKCRRDVERALVDVLSAVTHDSSSAELKRFCLMESPSLALPLMRCGVQVFHLPDSSSCARVCEIWNRLIPEASSAPHFRDLLAVELFRTLIDTLMQVKRWALDLETAMIGLAVLVYHRYVLDPSLPAELKSLAPRERLLALVGVKPERVAALEGSLAKASPKTRRMRFKGFLQDAIKCNPEAYRALQASGSVVKPPRLAVKDLPEKLVVFTKTKKNDAGEDVVVGAAELFGEDEDLSDL